MIDMWNGRQFQGLVCDLWWDIYLVDKIIIINEGENYHNKCAHASLVENSLLSSLPLVVTSVLEEIQLSSNRVDTSRGRTLEQLGDVFQMIPISINFIIY